MNGFDNAKTTIGVGFHKLLRLNRVRWEIFLQALVWNYRLQSLVLHDYGAYVNDNVYIEVSNDEEVDKDGPVIEASDGSWFWNSFEELRSKSIVDIEKEYMSKANIVGNFSQENLLIVNKIITEEGSRFRISLKDEYCVVSDYEDELSSLIACALARLSYDGKIMPLRRSINGSLERSFDKDQFSKQNVSSEGPEFESLNSPEILVTFGLADSNGKAKYSVVSLYAKDFCDFRNHCCFSELDYIDSLSRCERWDYAKEGKEKSIFFKTPNDRFIVKEIQRIEYESFVKFGPEYFKYMKDAYELGSKTCMVKVFGIYQVLYYILLSTSTCYLKVEFWV